MKDKYNLCVCQFVFKKICPLLGGRGGEGTSKNGLDRSRKVCEFWSESWKEPCLKGLVPWRRVWLVLQEAPESAEKGKMSARLAELEERATQSPLTRSGINPHWIGNTCYQPSLNQQHLLLIFTESAALVINLSTLTESATLVINLRYVGTGAWSLDILHNFVFRQKPKAFLSNVLDMMVQWAENSKIKLLVS